MQLALQALIQNKIIAVSKQPTTTCKLNVVYFDTIVNDYKDVEQQILQTVRFITEYLAVRAKNCG